MRRCVDDNVCCSASLLRRLLRGDSATRSELYAEPPEETCQHRTDRDPHRMRSAHIPPSAGAMKFPSQTVIITDKARLPGRWMPSGWGMGRIAVSGGKRADNATTLLSRHRRWGPKSTARRERKSSHQSDFLLWARRFNDRDPRESLSFEIPV